nr:hypothetical protein HmN_000609200 [Hymenolepis microstoma]
MIYDNLVFRCLLILKMLGKRKQQVSESDVEYLCELASKYANKSPYDGKGILILCKSLLPNTSKTMLMEYDIAKRIGDHKVAASVIAENCTSHNKHWYNEVNDIITGLLANPIDVICQKIFNALAPRVQCDLLLSYISSKFDNAADQTDFILKFLETKIDILKENNGTVECLFKKLVNILMLAEEDLFRILTSEPEQDEDIPDTPLSPESVEKVEENAKVPAMVAGSSVCNDDEGEEGEVIEENDEFDELIDEEEDPNRKRVGGKELAEVLNIYRMKLACEILPMIHKMRNNLKLGIHFLNNLVTNSLQFIFSFAVHIPFISKGYPKISGLNDDVPELLKNDPITLLRIYLDMASDLLRWSVKGSFQVLSRSEIFDTLKRAYHDYKELNHGSVGTNAKKRNQNILSAAGNQIASIFWSLFIETSLEYFTECREKVCIPFNISTVASVASETLDPTSNETLTGLLEGLQSLMSLRQKFKTHKKSKFRSPALGKEKLTLDDTLSALKPQGVIESGQFTCLLEFISCLGLTTGSLSEICEDVFANSDLISGVFNEEQTKIIQCLLNLTKLHLKPPKKAKDVAVERFRLILRLNELEVAEDSTNHTWNKLSNWVFLISLINPIDSLEICMAAIEQWLADSKNVIEAACLIMVLHQNPLWTRIPELSCEHTTEIMNSLQSDWSKARTLLSDWLKAGFIQCPGVLTQIVQMEMTCFSGNISESEVYKMCMELLQSPMGTILPSLRQFLKMETKCIKSCLNA